jgi:phosphoglycolate phosphatase
MLNHKAIIWDYNGTLLNDLAIGVLSINQMLKQRNLPLLTTEKYREVFTFPVKDYYESVGFNFKKEDWDATAKEFIANYTALLPQSTIFPEAKELLSFFAENGKKQFILSAMEQNMLLDSTKSENITNYFTEISGIDNIYASSKIENGKSLIAKHQLLPKEVCLLGDTSHDYEVAKELGCDCILVAAGHQSIEKLKETGCPYVVSHLKQIIQN